MSENQYFKTKSGVQFSGVSSQDLARMHGELSELGINRFQITEAASYSLAMVVRYALGLSATDGKVCAIVSDCLAGLTTLATLRHLVNAGANGILFSLKDPASYSEEFRAALKPLAGMGISLEVCGSVAAGSRANEVISTSHNVICGLYGGVEDNQKLLEVINILNEVQTPIHVVESPLGIDPDSGEKQNPLFASSTLSLGAPLNGLNPADDCVGRHYLCDISLTKEIYSRSGDDLSKLFAEQPVTQISPVLPA